jgi:hypothetical protein
MKRYLVLLVAGMALWMNGMAQSKTANFPKKVEYPKEMPAKKNFWIFIMAGQSNMAGRGVVEPQDTVPNPRILAMNLQDKWGVAKEPLHLYQPKVTGMDAGLSFARELLKQVGDSITIGLVPTAGGGSSIQYWMNDSIFNGVHLWSNFRDKTGTAMKYGVVKGILWHQGESDAFPAKIPVYKEKVETVLTRFRTFIGDDSLPIIMGELGSYTRPPLRAKRWAEINEIIKTVPNDLKNCYVVPTSDLTCNPDYIHFNNKSQRILGKRYADKYLQISSGKQETK